MEAAAEESATVVEMVLKSEGRESFLLEGEEGLSRWMDSTLPRWLVGAKDIVWDERERGREEGAQSSVQEKIKDIYYEKIEERVFDGFS